MWYILSFFHKTVLNKFINLCCSYYLTHLPLVLHICICKSGQHWLVQIMACHLFGAKPLSKPIVGYCQLEPLQQTSVKFSSKCKAFHSWKCISKYHLWNGGHFVSRGRWVHSKQAGHHFNIKMLSYSISILIIDIRWSQDYFIFLIWIAIPEKMVFRLKQGPSL